jgi:hypothetical protein
MQAMKMDAEDEGKIKTWVQGNAVGSPPLRRERRNVHAQELDIMSKPQCSNVSGLFFISEPWIG